MAAVRFRFRPMPTWTGPSTPPDRRRSRGSFRAGYSTTLGQLAHEIDLLGATEAVIEAGFRLDDIRLDGLPRANARPPSHPGIRVSFESKHGPLTYATDSHEAWQHNLRAIALGLEALRAVDRYGITRTGEQYRGWTAIEAAPAPATTREAAAVELARLAGWAQPPDIFDERPIARCYRDAARRCHPDTGGSTVLFQSLQQVMAVLRDGA